MPGLVPAMTVFPVNKHVDARDKPGHDNGNGERQVRRPLYVIAKP